MIFNEHQSRLWRDMLNCIENFRIGKLDYVDLVCQLEGALDAGEFKDDELIAQWYDLWTPLEIFHSQKGNNVTIEEAGKYLFDMESFLKSISIED